MTAIQSQAGQQVQQASSGIRDNHRRGTVGAFLGNDKTSICCSESPKPLAALLNSRLLFWVIQNTASTKSGGFYEFKPMYVSLLPIVDFYDSQIVEVLVDYILHVMSESEDSEAKPIVQYLEQIIDALVYETYLSKDLDEQDLSFFKHLESENLIAIDNITGNKLDAIRDMFHRLYSTDHLIRQNLFALDTVPSIRIIEGKA